MEQVTKYLGNDRIAHQGEQVVITSTTDMPDWRARRFRKIAVFFEGEKYFVADYLKLDKDSHRYVLERWPSDLNDLPGKIIEYDLEYVEARERVIEQVTNENRMYSILRPLSPFVGLLNSKVKLRLQETYGIDAQESTYYSLWIEYLFIVVVGAFLVIDMFTGGSNVILYFSFYCYCCPMPLSVMIMPSVRRRAPTVSTNGCFAAKNS